MCLQRNASSPTDSSSGGLDPRPDPCAFPSGYLPLGVPATTTTPATSSEFAYTSVCDVPGGGAAFALVPGASKLGTTIVSDAG